jgi:hypothetical protein
MIGARNDGMHDFGYDCFMPREITIDGLFVDDSNHPKNYEGMYFFTDPDGIHGRGEGLEPADRPFPYALCRKLTVRGLTTASGKKPRVSPSARVEKSTAVIEEDG